MVALDPTTGALLAMVSTPSYDPNPLVSHDYQKRAGGVRQAGQGPEQAAAQPRGVRRPSRPARRSRSWSRRPRWPTEPRPTRCCRRHELHRAGHHHADQQLARRGLPRADHAAERAAGLVQHAFARCGVEQLGAEKLKQAAQAFGFESVPAHRPGPRQRHCGSRPATPAPCSARTGADQPALAQSLHRAARGADDAAAGRPDRGGDRQQRRADASVPHRQLQGLRPDRVDDQAEGRSGASRSRPAWPTQLRQMMDGVVVQRHRHQGQDRRVRGRRQDRYGGERRRAGPRLVHRVRPQGRPARGRGGGLPAERRIGGSSEATEIAGQVMKAAIGREDQIMRVRVRWR